MIPHLGKRFHWKQERSAKALADYWWGADGLPHSIRSLLAHVDGLAGAELLEAWLERETDLQDGEGKPSQTDLLALLGMGIELAVLGVEAKAGESFGPTVHARLQGGSAEVHRRVNRLCEMLGLHPASADGLRYQLLHRTVAVLLEAKRFRATKAVLLVQSFRDDPKSHADYQSFVAALGFAAVERGALAGPWPVGGVDLWTGWVDSDVPACGLVIGDLRRLTSASPTRIGDKNHSIEQVVGATPWFEGDVGRSTDSMIDLVQVLSATGLTLAPDLKQLAA